MPYIIDHPESVRVLRSEEPMDAQVGWAKATMTTTRKPVALIVPGGILES